MPANRPRLSIGADRLSTGMAVYLDELLNRGLTAEIHDDWVSDALPAGVPKKTNVLFRSGNELILDMGDAIARIETGDGSCHLVVGASDGSVAEGYFGQLRNWIGESDISDGRLSVRFWAMGSYGPFTVHRPVDAPGWADIQRNYPLAITEELERLVKGPLDLRGGQMMIWQGPPGTGKTWALRALGREWQEWCDFEYITDPDRFLEDGAAYLLQVLLEGIDNFESGEERWRLLVLEDAGELLASNARERVGQGLSRFLNAADGFMGQGLRTIFLVTTNEELESLHPAVARPGRCFASVVFESFSAEEASQWLETEVKEPMTLAELYAFNRLKEKSR